MLFSASDEITFPNADNEELINLASSKRWSTEFDFFTLYEPARSIKFNVDDMYYVCDIFCDT